MPARSCVCCRTGEEKKSLLRVVLSEAGLVLDPAQRFPGRGAYLCVNCLGRKDLLGRLEQSLSEAAAKRGEKRVVRKVSGGFSELLASAAVAARNRRERTIIEGLEAKLAATPLREKPSGRARIGFRK